MQIHFVSSLEDYMKSTYQVLTRLPSINCSQTIIITKKCQGEPHALLMFRQHVLNDVCPESSYAT